MEASASVVVAGFDVAAARGHHLNRLDVALVRVLAELARHVVARHLELRALPVHPQGEVAVALADRVAQRRALPSVLRALVGMRTDELLADRLVLLWETTGLGRLDT